MNFVGRFVSRCPSASSGLLLAIVFFFSEDGCFGCLHTG